MLALLMAVGPLLGWRGSDGGTLLHSLRWPFGVAVAVTSGAIVLGVHDVRSIACVLVATFALGANVLMIARTLRGGWLRIGGYLAHVGMAILLVGIVGAYGYAMPEHKLVLTEGTTQRAYGHSFSFWGYEGRPDNKHALRLAVDADGPAPFAAFPELFFNERMGAWVRTPAIKHSLWQDLYISPEEYQPAGDPNTAVLGPGERGQIGPYQLSFDRFELNPQQMTAASGEVLVGATLTIADGTTVQTLTPLTRMDAGGQLTPLPLPLADGRELLLDGVSARARLVRIRITGLNLPITPARAVFTVSFKPAIALVWLGALLMFAGGALAVLGRYRERVGVAAWATRPQATWSPPVPAASFASQRDGV